MKTPQDLKDGFRAEPSSRLKTPQDLKDGFRGPSEPHGGVKWIASNRGGDLDLPVHPLTRREQRESERKLKDEADKAVKDAEDKIAAEVAKQRAIDKVANDKARKEQKEESDAEIRKIWNKLNEPPPFKIEDERVWTFDDIFPFYCEPTSDAAGAPVAGTVSVYRGYFTVLHVVDEEINAGDDLGVLLGLWTEVTVPAGGFIVLQAEISAGAASASLVFKSARPDATTASWYYIPIAEVDLDTDGNVVVIEQLQRSDFVIGGAV